MATINVSNLYPAGYELFSDSNNFMSELSDNEFGQINGGCPWGGILTGMFQLVSVNYELKA